MSDTEKDRKPTAGDTPMPLDLEGSEQHHDLKNQPGEQGDPDHADGAGSEGETADTIKEALGGLKDKNAMSAAMKGAVK